MCTTVGLSKALNSNISGGTEKGSWREEKTKSVWPAVQLENILFGIGAVYIGMDPFTEKLLERTRARRENLQRKIAERPASGTRPLVKRSREPLTESNTVICETVSEKALPSNLSPIKRRCSDENTLLTKEENRQLSPAQIISSDPMTDKKPPLASRSIQPLMVEKKPSHYLPEPVRQPSHCASAVKMVSPPQSQVKSTNIERKNFALDDARETCQDTPTSFPNSMRSRLQKLAEQRQYWESEGASEAVQESISPLKIKKAEPPLTPASHSSGFSTGRKGRFANLAAKIGSWEDDQAQRATTQVQLDVANVTPVSTMTKPAVYSSIKSNREVHTSPQKMELPRTKLAQSVSSQSPLKNQKASNVHFEAPVESTSKPILTPKPKYSAHPTVVPKSPEKLVKVSTPMEHRSTVGTSGVKSFLERFEEKCQERSQNSTSTLAGLTTAATPKTRMIQERLVAMPSISSTAILTQKQKKEREAELAEIRNRSPMPSNEKKISEEPELSLQSKLLVSPKTNDLATVPANHKNPSKSSTKDLECSLPNDSKQNGDFSITVGGEKTHEAEETNEVHDIETVDGSVTSEIINELFDGVLDESDDVGDDALNISSMSLLAPLSETVATVIRSPVRDLMTSTPAGSFNMKSSTPNNVSRSGLFQNTCILASESSDSIDSIDAKPNQNLLYSIDAYRSTRVKTTERPRVKEMAKKEDVSQKMDTDGPFSHAKVKQKIKNLTNEMNLQQTVIHQASQALNCCTDEEHGKGSQVEAEAERLLLIATERRAALKAELDQLKSEDQKNKKRMTPNAQADMAISASKGSISLLELRLPLKADFICSSVKKPEAGSHYFFVMIRSGAENTVSTPLANTCNALSGDALTFTTKFTLSNVSNDFEIDIEVYCFLQKRELNSDKRKKPNKSKAITPKRFLAISKSNLQTPVLASPGGPNAVRTSNFVLVGSHKITLASIGKNKFPLEKIKYEGNERQLLSDMFHHKVPFLCPLEGHVYLKMQCEVGSGVEEKGFLTMFEDVSGFGAWHRRWCVLSGYSISYWTYPDHEKRKNPIGRINLANCTSRKIEPANREFCARPNTFELITVRPQKDDDCETLVTQCKNTLCVTKNWLSADTKDERNLWMMKINQILVDLRTWQPDSCYKPM